MTRPILILLLSLAATGAHAQDAASEAYKPPAGQSAAPADTAVTAQPSVVPPASGDLDEVAPAAAESGASHFRVVVYDPTGVVPLDGCLNFQTVITLADDEHVQNVGVGNSAAWQVTPNKRGNLVFVKPLTASGFTNMTVVSDKRSYNFELRNADAADCAAGNVVYSLSFSYAPDPAAAPATTVPVDPDAFLPPVEKRNTAYTYSGAVELVPLRVFDDGNSTYLHWVDGVSTPAVYALNSDNTESLVNYAARGDYIVVEQIAPAFVLRRGEQKAILYNDSYRLQGLDAQSPRPRGKSGGH